MPDETYKIIYDTSSAVQARKYIDELAQAVYDLDAMVERSKKNLSGFAGGASRSASAATKKIQGLNAALSQTAPAANTAAYAMNNMGGSAIGAAGNIGEMRMAMMGITAGVAIVKSLSDAFDEAKEYAHQVAEEAGNIRDITRELKTLSGDEAGSDKAMIGAVKLSAESGATVAKSASFSAKFDAGMSRGTDKGNIDEKTKGELRAEAMTTARRLGIDEDVMGKFAGGLAGYGKIPNIKTAMNQIGGAMWGASQGRDTYTEHVKAFQKLGPKVIGGEGGFKDAAEAMIALGVVDPIGGSADNAQNMIQQSRRLVNSNKPEHAAALKKFGINPSDDYVTKMEKLAPHITGAEGERVLFDAGFHLAPQNAATVAIAKEAAVMRKRIDEKRRRDFGQEAMDKNNAFLKSDPASVRATAKAGRVAARLTRGLGDKELYDTAKIDAEADLTTSGNIDTPATNLKDRFLNIMAASAITGANNRGERIHTQARDKLAAEFGKRGVGRTEFRNRYYGLFSTRGMYNEDERAADYGRATADLRKLDPKASAITNKEVLDRLDRIAASNEALLAEEKRGVAPQRAPGKAAAAPMRP
jgi:hypothetical protein